MEKVMPPFKYEPLVLSLKRKTSNEEEDKGDIDGVRPLGKGIAEEIRDLKRGKDRLERETDKQTLE
jgi:hypothetical protein